MFSSQEVILAEWERSAVVTVWIRVRILMVSYVWFEFLHFRVAWTSDLFAPSKGYVCYFHWRAKSHRFHSCALNVLSPSHH